MNNVNHHIVLWFSIILSVYRDKWTGEVERREFSHVLFSRDKNRTRQVGPGQEVWVEDGMTHTDYLLLPEDTSVRRKFAQFTKGYDPTVKVFKVSDASLFNQMLGHYEVAYQEYLDNHPMLSKMLFAQYGEEWIARMPLSLHEVCAPDTYLIRCLRSNDEDTGWYEDTEYDRNRQEFVGLAPAWKEAEKYVKRTHPFARVQIYIKDRNGMGIPSLYHNDGNGWEIVASVDHTSKFLNTK